MAKRVNEGIPVNTAEMLAIMLALQWAEETKKMLIKKIIIMICSDCSSSLVTLQFSHSERWKRHSKRSKTSTFLSSDWPVGSFSMGTSTQERHPIAVKGTHEVARTAARYSWYTAE